MASPTRSSVCAVCYEKGSDRRLLPCLHSCCARCIDQLALRSESGDFDLQCPLCRTRVRLPPDGAAGLPKDPTQSEVEEHACSACKDEGKTGKATVWCRTCKCALCTSHVGSHMMSGSGPSSSKSKLSPPESSAIGVYQAQIAFEVLLQEVQRCCVRRLYGYRISQRA